MILDIKRTVIRVQLRRLITLLVVFALILMIVLLGNVKNLVLGLNKYEWGMIIGILYILSMILEGMFELNYIFFSDEKEKLVFRYFSMSVFNRRKNSIEIPKETFVGYEIKESLQGLKKKIVLIQQFKDKEAWYPAVSISSLNRSERTALLRCLDKYRKN